jgi:hypothetical protein
MSTFFSITATYVSHITNIQKYTVIVIVDVTIPSSFCKVEKDVLLVFSENVGKISNTNPEWTTSSNFI